MLNFSGETRKLEGAVLVKQENFFEGVKYGILSPQELRRRTLLVLKIITRKSEEVRELVSD